MRLWGKMKTHSESIPKYEKKSASDPFAAAHPSVASHSPSLKLSDDLDAGVPLSRAEAPTRRHHPRAGTTILAKKKK